MWKPLISGLAFNRLRLKKLIENQPPPAPELPAKNNDGVYDCTPQLELFRALGLHLKPKDAELSVGLVVPDFWIRGHDEPDNETQELAILIRYMADTAGPSSRLQHWWWSVERMVDEKTIKNMAQSTASKIFEGPQDFVAWMEKIDGNLHQVIFRALPLSDKPSRFSSYEEAINNSTVPITARLQMALGIGIGMIFLSPTPWFSSDSYPLREKIFFFGDHLKAFEHVLFVPHYAPLVPYYVPQSIWPKYDTIPEMGSILFELGLALTELALRRTLSREEKLRLRDITRTGLIAMEMGVEYQDIVNVCLTRKYENASGVVTEIDESLASFREHANEAIIVPLRLLWLESQLKNISGVEKKKVVTTRGQSQSGGKARASSMEIISDSVARGARAAGW